MSANGSPLFDGSWLELPDGNSLWLKDRCVIGRQEGCDLVLATPALSRQHALLAAAPGGYTLTDLQSSNGTYLNREPVRRPVPLRDGDEIRIGDMTLRFRCNRKLDLGGGGSDEFATRRLDDVRSRQCWLLVADVVGYSGLNEQIGSEAALRRLQVWINEMRPVLEKNGASINGYVGDAIFAYWACDVTMPEQVLAALAGLEAYRKRSPLPFRIVVHHGCALFSRSEKGDELSGQDVNLVFRAEKTAKKFKVDAMLSQAAAQTLLVEGRCAALGSSPVDGMSGTFSFYGFPRDLRGPASSG
jgi:pSer/pThr/pTyr-binding forkhead associated (FHA) protein